MTSEATEKAIAEAIARHFPYGPEPQKWQNTGNTPAEEPPENECRYCDEPLDSVLAPFRRHLLCGPPTATAKGHVMHQKETWEATLPPWRDGAVGRYTDGEVFLVAVLRSQPDRCIRIHVKSEHARALAADLVSAAEKADTPRREVA